MEKIIEEDELSGSHLFRVKSTDSQNEIEAILVESDDGVQCWQNYCMHITDVKIQKEDEILPERDDKILCKNHGAMFRKTDGMCTHGPCKNAALESVDIEVSDGVIHLTDEEFSYVGDGGIDDSTIPGSTTGELGF